MRLFSALYARAMVWARHPRAPYFLAGLSFAESSFFPIPPDVMLAPMALARPRQAWAYAAITTAASVVGGLAGYLIGWLAFGLIEPILQRAGYWEGYLAARAWFDAWGFWAIFVAGFSPIPYKLFTIAAGVIGMPLVPFVLASTIGRGGRFFLVAGLMARGGERMEKALHRYVDRIGWATVVALVVVYFWAR
ncbi:membrane protein [Sulfurifustis variabilis]|uniref:Membrane protein n=1 Tax=Sulfurifustis variabilis TaxID=1675686 RepID=A0A1B4V667_9GAMM|nr:YqaA family protein [Sulfurifustis variabilis]BAU49063.1 membrane protein [Sulfurifustis variabilis]